MLKLDQKLLTHLLGYACPEGFQSIALTCKLFHTCTQSPLFWSHAIHTGLRNLLASIGIMDVPPIAFEDFNPFFRPKRMHYLPSNIPKHSLLNWLFFPNDRKLSYATHAQPLGHIIVAIRDKKDGFGINFEWTLNYETCRFAVGLITALGRVKCGTYYSNTYLRHPHLIYSERIAYQKVYIVMYLECFEIKNETVHVWHGRGKELTYESDDIPLPRAIPDETDPHGYYKEIK